MRSVRIMPSATPFPGTVEEPAVMSDPATELTAFISISMTTTANGAAAGYGHCLPGRPRVHLQVLGDGVGWQPDQCEGLARQTGERRASGFVRRAPVRRRQRIRTGVENAGIDQWERPTRRQRGALGVIGHVVPPSTPVGPAWRVDGGGRQPWFRTARTSGSSFAIRLHSSVLMTIKVATIGTVNPETTAKEPVYFAVIKYKCTAGRP
jgi:hypothetical protein